MQAILISEENFHKIVEAGAPSDRLEYSYKTYLNSSRNWYAIKDYLDPITGEPRQPWTVLPEYIIKESYIFDPVKIQTEWDTIYRLAH